MDTPERRLRLKQSAVRLVEMIEREMPDELIARECISVFRHGLVTFEAIAGEVFSNWLIKSIRVNCGQYGAAPTKSRTTDLQPVYEPYRFGLFATRTRRRRGRRRV